MSSGESVRDTLQERYVFPEEKYDTINLKHFRVIDDWIERWAEMPSIVDDEFRDNTVRKFIEFHNLDNPAVPRTEKDGAKEAHHSFTDYLYSDNILPCIASIHQWATLTGNEAALKKSSAALVFLNDAMDLLSNHAQSLDGDAGSSSSKDHKSSMSSALADLLSDTIDGNPTSLQFVSLMKIARIQARQCLWESRDAPIDDVIAPINNVPFSVRVEQALNEFAEAKSGIQLPDYFIDRLIDPETTALVISLDYNSTFNKHESYTTVELLKIVNQKLKKLTKLFKKYFPEKDIFVVINTGRPSMYAWGVVESSLEPIDALRTVALAESGGAMLKEPMSKGAAEATVNNPIQWKLQLDELRQFFASQISTTARFEEKLSMVSLEIAPKNGDENTWLHKNLEGGDVTDIWLQEQLTIYLDQAYRETVLEYAELLSEQEKLPGLSEIVDRLTKGQDGIAQTADDISPEMLEVVKEIFERNQTALPERIDTLKKKIEVLRLMREGLVVKFNQTAGFADVMLEHQNKLSGLMLAMRKRGHLPSQIAAIHVGDAKVDIMPEEKDEQNREIPENEGADDVLVVGVNNSSADLINHIEKRATHGYRTARKSAAGVIDLFEGLIKMLPYASAKKGRVFPIITVPER